MTDSVFYARIPEAVLYDDRLTSLDVRVYGVLDRYANGTGECWPGIDRIADLVVATPRAVKNSTRRLKEAGHIEVVRRGRTLTNLYRVMGTKRPITHGVRGTKRPISEGNESTGVRGTKRPPNQSHRTKATNTRDLTEHEIDEMRALVESFATKGMTMTHFESNEWLRSLRDLAKRFTAEEIVKVSRWLLREGDPIAQRWRPLINGPEDLLEHWPEMRADYLDSRDRPILSAAPSPPSSNGHGDPAAFEQFWEVWPRKVAKGAARRAFARVAKGTDPEVITAGVRRYVAAGLPEPKFIPYPATWLNAERWLDEPEPSTEPSWPKQTMGGPA